MKEIKFRAWEKNRKEMLEVLGIFFDVGTIKHKLLKLKGNTNPFNEGYPNTYFKDIELMQYTGLKDKNGKEIYEGDIVRIPHWSREYTCSECGYTHKSDGVAKIIWANETFGCGDHYRSVAGFHFRIGMNDFELADVEEWEVIGNIYENHHYWR